VSFPAPPRSASSGARRRRGPLAPTLLVLGGLLIVTLTLAQFWTEVLWFRQIGYVEVIRTQWIAQAVLFLLGGGIMAAAVLGNLTIAYRARPIYAPMTAEQQNLDRYRESIEPLRRLVLFGAPILLGLFAGSAAAARWQDVLLWLNRVPFGERDPQFGLDVSFFVFTLPITRFAVSFLMTVTFLSAVVAVVTHYLYGGIRVATPGTQVTRQARTQLATLGAVFVLLIAVSYWLDRYSMLVKTGERFDGASYTDINAVLPAKTILAGIAVVVAALFVVTAIRGDWRLPAIGVGLMVVSGIVVGGIYPYVVEQFQVEPNAQELERPYLQRNIDGTLAAFGLEDVETQNYQATTTAEPGALRADAETTASIRILDPAVVSPSFRQLQQNKQYYDFPDILAVDRYDIEGEKRDTVIAVRELDLDGHGENQRTWINDHTVFTHGFGVVAAFGNTTALDGRPAFFEGGIPNVGELEVDEPRIYFGQEMAAYEKPSFSIVGAPEGTEPWELDYPDDNAPNGQVNTTYEGDGGPSIGNAWNKLLFAIRFGSQQILFSDRVTAESQILFDRDPQVRVEKVAPFLTLDGRTYPAVVDGQVVWIVDGYTSSNDYPYSAREALELASTDSLTDLTVTTGATLQEPHRLNYIRNSVKAVVNAYDGSVTLYAWDTNDPILASWMQVFPGKVRPMSEITGELMSHLRYPEDLFKVQRHLLARYHVTDAASFYSGQDFWRSPNDPTSPRSLAQPPYYLTLEMPSQDEPTFSLTSTYIPGGETGRNVLTGFLAVDAEAGSTAGQPREGYGQLRVLQLRRDITVPGPGQVQNNFNSDPTVSQSLNLLRQGDSDVVNGNLLTLPMGGGLLYVQPVYVQSSTGTRFPLLQKVLVAFGDEIGFGDTLNEALDQVFGGDSGAEAGDADQPPEETPGDGAAEEPGTGEGDGAGAGDGGAVDGAVQARLEAALQAARDALEDSSQALSAGDWQAYGEAQERLAAAVEEALRAQEELTP
jgi:uncharacterized membrane protein (UPF0182 family)